MKHNVKQDSKKSKDTKSVGVSQNFWVWGSKIPSKKNEPKSVENVNNQDSINDEINQLLVENPNINGATFLNLLKSKGYQIVKNDILSLDDLSNNENLMEPAHWVLDEDVWEKAKKAASKSYDKEDPAYWPVVVTIYKNMGGKIKKKDKKKEADSASTNVAQQRESIQIKINAASFKEAAKSGDPVGATKFGVVLIKEGLGTFSTSFFYTKEALKNAISIFEGKKIYADHPTSIEEQTRPERSVRDVLGHFENVRYIEENDRGMLYADVVILPDEPYRWARALMRHAIEYSEKYPDKDFVGLSINASGTYEPTDIDEILSTVKNDDIKVKLLEAKQKGIQEVKLVKNFKDAISCDLVTEAGADGKILNIKESEKGEAMKQQHADEKEDIELIKKMIAEYLGDSSDEEKEAALEAFHEMKNSYQETSEAVKAACEAMKCAKKLAEKKAKQAEQSEQADDKKEEKKNEQKEAETKENQKVIESLKKEIAELKGQLASFKEAAMKSELANLINEKLKTVKDEAIVKDIKESAMKATSKDEALKIVESFLKGYSAQIKENKFDFSISVEKSSPMNNEKSFSFKNCIN